MGQNGGEKGNSISHYLIDFVNYIMYNQDQQVPLAVLAVMVDFSQAFNRINHSVVITILSEMGVPGWLLRIVIGFLTDRELLVRFKGKTSSRKSLPGGGPQGTRLGLFLFLILINAAGCGRLQEHLGKYATRGLNKRTPILKTHMKYVDDMTEAVAINLKKFIVPNPDPNPPRPLAYHDRTGHMAPVGYRCPLQDELDKLLQYCNKNEMVVNEKKTKVALFNTSWKYDYMPLLSVQKNKNLMVVEEFKLLGIIFQTDLNWYANSQHMCEKGYSRLWMLRRLRLLGATSDEMLDVYNKQVRCIMEMAVAVWQPGLSQAEDKQIERVQKAAFSIILGDQYFNYKNALKYLECESLNSRRKRLCLNFAKKSEKHPKYQNWFVKNTQEVKPATRTEKTIYKPVSTRTDRYFYSPLPYLTRLLNQTK